MTVVQLRVDELTNLQLDALVAQIEGVDWRFERDDYGGEFLSVDVGVGDHGRLPRARYSPSTSWADGGHIIDEFPIAVSADSMDDREDRVPGVWFATAWPDVEAQGSTALTAAMRAYVAAKLGDTVELPG